MVMESSEYLALMLETTRVHPSMGLGALERAESSSPQEGTKLEQNRVSVIAESLMIHAPTAWSDGCVVSGRCECSARGLVVGNS